MARKRGTLTVTLRQESIKDPQSVAEGLELWAMYLARHARELLDRAQMEEAPDERSGAAAGD